MTGVSALTVSLDEIADRWGTSEEAYYVSTNTDYAVHVEFGTSRAQAQPYMRPAAEHAKRNLGKWSKEASSLRGLLARIVLEIEAYAKDVVPVDTGALRASIRAHRADGSDVTTLDTNIPFGG